MSCTIVGIAGGSGSGKTTFARALKEAITREFGPESCALISQDSYYRDQSDRFDHDGGAVNFDHPDALDFPLLVEHLTQLRAGQTAQIPIYDFATHRRLAKTVPQKPAPIVLVDGILIFQSEKLRPLFDRLFYFEAPESLRFDRRLRRDTEERGRTEEGVRNQFLKQVKPMHDLYVEPTQSYADRVIRTCGDGKDFEAALADATRELTQKLRNG